MVYKRVDKSKSTQLGIVVKNRVSKMDNQKEKTDKEKRPRYDRFIEDGNYVTIIKKKDKG